MKDVKVGQLNPSGLYVVVANPGYSTVGVEGVSWNDGISNPLTGAHIKRMVPFLASTSKFYQYPCSVVRGPGLSYEVLEEAPSPSADTISDATSGLPELPELDLSELPVNLPKSYRDLLNNYRKFGKGYRLKNA